MQDSGIHIDSIEGNKTKSFEEISAELDKISQSLEGEEKTKEEISEEIKRISAQLDEVGGETHNSERIRRNDLCICGSGTKFKKCCKPKYDAYRKEDIEIQDLQSYKRSLEREFKRLSKV